MSKMMIHVILWISLCAFSLGGTELPDSVLSESCMEGICDKSHTLTDELSNIYNVEQQNTDISEKSVLEQISDNIDSNVGNDHSSCTFCDDNSDYHASSDHSGQLQEDKIFSDKHSDRLDNLDGFHENEAAERIAVNPPTGNAETEEMNVLLSSESAENLEHETAIPELEVVGFSRVEKDKNNNDDTAKKETNEPQLEQPLARRRYFPLLYTIRTLLNSLLSEFGDDGGNQETVFNASDTPTGNLTMPDDQIKDLNTTINGTDSTRKTRFQCAVKNITDNTTGEVKIVNSTELLEILNFSKNQKVSPCVLVMFYAPWCHFCARAAPHYNALARAFPQLDVLAVDTSHFSYLNARFGTVAVPNLMLFHARSAVRFNHTARALENFTQFVANNTGLESDKSVKLEPSDFVGPLPSVVVRGRDWLLWLAWTFVIVCTTYGFVRSHYGQSFITWLRVLWQEHQHIE